MDPWPTWDYQLADGTRVIQELFVQHDTGVTVVVWTLARATGPVTLRVRPFLSGRDYHSMHHENGAFRFAADRRDAVIAFAAYDGVPRIVALSNGEYRHAPEWFRNFLYTAERGVDDASRISRRRGIQLAAVGAGRAGRVGASRRRGR